MSDESISATLSMESAVTSTTSLVADLYTLFKKAGVKKYQNWKISGGARSLHTKLKRYRMVKTILNLEKTADLATFYFPTNLTQDNSKYHDTFEGRDLKAFKTTDPILIVGKVGQGKSIFLRYLASREIVRGASKLPLFLELRNIHGKSLEAFLVEELRSLNLPMSAEIFDYLATNGKFAIFLDGFDEIDDERQAQVIDQIHGMSRRYGECRFVVSSRPSSAIVSSDWLKVYYIAELSRYSVPDLIHRLVDYTTAESLLAQLHLNQNVLTDVLISPLMVALLIVRFKIEQTVPETDIAFFEDLFDLLLRRHDQLKGGFRRKRKSKIGDYDLGRVFNGVSFLSQRRGNNSEFRLNELHADISSVCRSLTISDRADDISDDIIKITNLILEEGGYCRYVHRSVQEFHAAQFVAMVGNKFASKFYMTAFVRPGWEQVLRFLKQIDKEGFRRHLLLPILRQWLSRTTFGADWYLSVTGVKDGDLRDRPTLDRFHLLLDDIIDTSKVLMAPPHRASQELKRLRDVTMESVRQFEAIKDDFELKGPE